MFDWTFWKDALERSLKTIAQTLIATWTASEGFNLFNVDWKGTLGVAGGAAILSILMSMATAQVRQTQSASLVVDTVEPGVVDKLVEDDHGK